MVAYYRSGGKIIYGLEPIRWIKVVGFTHILLNFMGLFVYGTDFLVRIFQFWKNHHEYQKDAEPIFGGIKAGSFIILECPTLLAMQITGCFVLFMFSGYFGIPLIRASYEKKSTYLTMCIAGAVQVMLWSFFCTILDANILTAAWLLIASVTHGGEIWIARRLRKQLILEKLEFDKMITKTVINSKSKLLGKPLMLPYTFNTAVAAK